MSLTIRFDAATPIRLTDPDGVVPATCSVAFVGSDGADKLLTGSVTLPSASSTVSASTTTSATLASATGFVAGLPVAVVAGGRAQVAVVTRIETNTLRFSVALDAGADVGSTVKAITATASVAAPGTALLGGNHKIVWTYAGSDGVSRQRVEAVTVARWIPDQSVSANDVKGIAALISPSSIASPSRDQTYWTGIAERVAQRVEAELSATGKRQACYGDPNAFRESGRLMARLYLADDGLMPAGVMGDSYTKDLSIRLQGELRTALAGLSYDTDGNGAINGNESINRFYTIRVTL